MSTQRRNLTHLCGHMMAAIDFETTGRRAGYHEIIQIAVVPLTSDLEPSALRPFCTTVCPEFPERQEPQAGHVHGLPLKELVDQSPPAGKVADLFVEWVKSLDLPFERKLVPLAHNWAFESAFLNAWLGPDLVFDVFHAHARDAMLYANSLNDRAVLAGEDPPFKRTSLRALCRALKVSNPNPHDALNDAIAEAGVYKALLQLELF